MICLGGQYNANPTLDSQVIAMHVQARCLKHAITTPHIYLYTCTYTTAQLSNNDQQDRQHVYTQ